MCRRTVEKSKIFISQIDDVDQIFEKSWCIHAND